MEFISGIYTWVVSIIGGLSIASIISAIIYGSLKGAFNKTISKINVQKIADTATEKGVERVKKISFTHNIQPLVESGLEKVNEKSNEYIENSVKRLEEKLDKVILIQEKQAAYFDNSIGVSEQAKEDLKKAIADAKNEPIIAESFVVDEEEKIETPKETVELIKPTKKTKVER